jgi:predicted O-methyltransferase YrrM
MLKISRLSLLLLALITLVLVLWGQGQRRGALTSNEALPMGKTEGEKKILSVLDEVQKTKKTYLSVPVADGRMLRLLTEAVGAKTVAEFGTSTGFSGLWFCLALQKTGGKLITFELDAGRAATARKHFEQAGVSQIVTIVEGDAHKNLTTLKGPIDVVFIDAEKEGYVDYLNKVLPLVRSGGLILAHNINMPAVADGYVKQVTADPELETVFYMDGGGLSVTLKKR